MDTKEIMARLYMIEKEIIQLDGDLKKAATDLRGGEREGEVTSGQWLRQKAGR